AARLGGLAEGLLESLDSCGDHLREPDQRRQRGTTPAQFVHDRVHRDALRVMTVVVAEHGRDATVVADPEMAFRPPFHAVRRLLDRYIVHGWHPSTGIRGIPSFQANGRRCPRRSLTL